MVPMPLLPVADVTFFFNDWQAVARVLFITLTGYLTLLLLLRANGQRTLAQLSSLDLVITVTIGSAFGRVITARQVALIEVVAAFVALIVLQRIVAELWNRAPRLRSTVTVTPALLYYEGRPVEAALKRHRLQEADLATAARQEGLGSLSEARAIVLEGNGGFSVLTDAQFGEGDAVRHLADDHHPPGEPQ